MKKIPDSMTIGEAKKLGRYGDEALVHLNKAEVAMLDGMTYGHGLTINPETGEKEAFLPFLLSALPALFPGIGAALGAGTGLSFLANPMVLGAIGSGLGTAIETGDVGKGVLAGLGGAALGHFGGSLFGGAGGAAGSEAAKGVASKLAANGGANLIPNVGQGIANTGGSMAASFAPNAVQSMNGMVPQGLANMGRAAAPYGLMQAGLVSMPGAYMASQEAMKYNETDADKRKKERVARAQQENFLAPRQVMQAPTDYRHGFDPEFSFFNPAGTLTPVTTTRQYAGGGLVAPQINGGPNPGPRPMMPVPTALSGKTWAQPQINPGIGTWGGLTQRPVTPPTTPPVIPPRPTYPGTGGVVGGGLGRGGGGDWGGFGGGRDQIDDVNMRLHMEDLMRVRRFSQGGLIEGPGDGTSDSIPAVINGREPAAISDGEFIISADVVAALGNGSTKAGAAKLQAMMDAVRAGVA